MYRILSECWAIDTKWRFDFLKSNQYLCPYFLAPTEKIKIAQILIPLLGSLLFLSIAYNVARMCRRRRAEACERRLVTNDTENVQNSKRNSTFIENGKTKIQLHLLMKNFTFSWIPFSKCLPPSILIYSLTKNLSISISAYVTPTDESGNDLPPSYDQAVAESAQSRPAVWNSSRKFS